jgi:FkbM family methyltransferase
MRGTRLLKRLRGAWRGDDHRVSYAQCGEDLLLRFLFDLLGIPRPTYLDIGAHHPFHLSNTYLFYQSGSRGVCIEPDPTLAKAFQFKRPGDQCLNIGISAGLAGQMEFYIFDDPSMNTFSPVVKEEQVQAGRLLRQVLEIPVLPVNNVIRKHFSVHPNLVSLDTEGMDLTILESLDFSKHRPEVFCIETLTNVGERKMTEIIDFMASQEYAVYADTYINSIFVDSRRWSARMVNSAEIAPVQPASK